MQVESFLEDSARRHGAKTALVAGARRASYAEIDEQSNRLAWALVGEGVKRGDRVAIHLENSLEAVLAIFAVLKAGAVFVAIYPGTKADKLRYILANCGASALIAHGERRDLLESALAPTSPDAALTRTPALGVVLLTGARSGHGVVGGKPVVWIDELLEGFGGCGDPLPKQCIDLDLAALIYTSGSTGFPKGVMMTHLALTSAATSISTYLENTPEDVILSVLPLSYGYGLSQILTAFRCGASVILERSLGYPAQVLERIARERATGFPMVPTAAALLLQLDLAKWDLSSLRYMTNAGAALPPEHIARLRRALPQVRLYSMYGLTECTRVTYLPPEQLAIRPASVGKGMPNEELYVLDPEGRRCAPGEIGELVVRGSHLMQGYWGMPDATARALRCGPLPGQRVLYSGDLFRTDEEGYLYFVARQDDIIKTRGEKVSPREVEDVLYELPGVSQAAVVGVPDPLLGAAIKAVLVLAAGFELTRQAVLRHCAARLEDFMVPRIVEFREELPQTASGKIARALLAQQPEEVV